MRLRVFIIRFCLSGMLFLTVFAVYTSAAVSPVALVFSSEADVTADESDEQGKFASLLFSSFSDCIPPAESRVSYSVPGRLPLAKLPSLLKITFKAVKRQEDHFVRQKRLLYNGSPVCYAKAVNQYYVYGLRHILC